MFTKRDILKMVLPLIAQNILTTAVNTADSIMVASGGEAAVSAVSLVGSIDILLVILFSSLVTGGTVSVSHAVGGKKLDLARHSAKQLLYCSTIIAVLVTVFASIFCRSLLYGLYASAEHTVIENSIAYMSIIVLSFPLLAIYESGTALLRVMGDTVTSMVLSLISNIINIIGNAIFIFGFGMGVAGAALGTAIARLFCAVAITVILHQKKRPIYYEKLYQYKPDFAVIKKILQIGVPHGIETSMFQFGRLVTQVLISSLGTASIAANSVANTLANYHYMPAVAIQNIAVTIVGRCYGANEHDQAKKNARLLLWWSYLCMWAVSLILFLFLNPILNIYNLSAEGMNLAFAIITFHSISVSLIRPLAFLLPPIFKATGDVKMSMVVSTLSMWIVRVGCAYILSLDCISLLGFSIPGFGLGIMGVWIAMIADWAVRALLFTPYFLRNKWLHASHCG